MGDGARSSPGANSPPHVYLPPAPPFFTLPAAFTPRPLCHRQFCMSGSLSKEAAQEGGCSKMVYYMEQQVLEKDPGSTIPSNARSNFMSESTYAFTDTTH